jgi:predicted HNH restriction endonuclease
MANNLGINFIGDIVEDKISFDFFLAHCSDNGGGCRNFWCESNGHIYGHKMKFDIIQIIHNVEYGETIVAQNINEKGNVQKGEFQGTFKQLVNYISKDDKVFQRMKDYQTAVKFRIYTQSEFLKLKDVDKKRCDEIFRSDGQFYISRNVNICEQMKYCCEILDEDVRNNWFFKITLFSTESYFEAIKKQADKEKNNKFKEASKAKKMSDEDLYQKIIQLGKVTSIDENASGSRKHTSKSSVEGRNLGYERNEYVAEWAKRRASGKCDLCRKYNTFKYNTLESESEIWYMEAHHVLPLAKGGTDTLDNVVSLCPNCHRKVHIIKDKEDRRQLEQMIMYYQNNEMSRR